MPKKIRPLLVEKYDITHNILNHIIDLETRYILFSIVKRPMRVQEISRRINIPLSTAYKKIDELTKLSLVSERKDFGKDGRVVKLYQSKIQDVEISISNFEPSISFRKNPHHDD